MRPKLRSPSMILGIVFVGVGVSISAIALWTASGLPTSGSGGFRIVSGFHPTALLPGVFPISDPITAYANQLYHIALYSEVVTVVGVALIVDAFLGNPFSRLESLLLKRARLSILLRKVKSEKEKFSSMGQKDGSQKKNAAEEESVDRKLRNLRRLEISLESDLRDVEWNIREASEVNPFQVGAVAGKEEPVKKRISLKEKIRRFLGLTASQQALRLILDDVTAVAKEERKDKESLRILLEDRANQLRALSGISTSKKEFNEIEDIHYIIVRLSRGQKIEERVLSRLPDDVRKRIKKAEGYIMG